MKKLAILAIAAFTFASCTKNYTCKCVTPETEATNQMEYKTNTKSHANRLCKDWQGRQQSAVAGQANVECRIQ